MSFQSISDRLRAGSEAKFPENANSAEFADELDAQDPLSHLRDQFILPTKASIKKTELDGRLPDDSTAANGASSGPDPDEETRSIYFVGNSLGPQPKLVRKYIDAQLETWASIGVNGHFTQLGKSPLPAWQDLAEDCAAKSTDLMGASAGEIIYMNAITTNLHLMMASFYRPTAERHKIMLEWKPFPSDFYAMESHLQWHGLDPRESMVQIQPEDGYLIPTESVLAAIDEHADQTALLLLPGIQYYSGQLFDMERITRHAHARGIPFVGWDLAHCAGNVELRLHDWDVDFACWCTYKYLNAGPGSTAGAFVHERHGRLEGGSDAGSGSGSGSGFRFRPRLTGWYGGDKSVRFEMDNRFRPSPGAAGFQLSNPSALDLASLSAALSVFNMTTMRQVRSKSLLLTAYAEHLLDQIVADESSAGAADAAEPPFRIITPRDPAQRGTQLSVLLRDGLLDRVQPALEASGVMCDKRKPGVIRVAPSPLYTTAKDVYAFMTVLRNVLAL